MEYQQVSLRDPAVRNIFSVLHDRKLLRELATSNSHTPLTDFPSRRTTANSSGRTQRISNVQTTQEAGKEIVKRKKRLLRKAKTTG